MPDEYKRIMLDVKVSETTQKAVKKVADDTDEIGKKTTNYMKNLRSAELMIYRGTALLEGGIRIAEHLGVKVDKGIKDTINDVQQLTAFIASATIMAKKLQGIITAAQAGIIGAIGGAAGSAAIGAVSGYQAYQRGGGLAGALWMATPFGMMAWLLSQLGIEVPEPGSARRQGGGGTTSTSGGGGGQQGERPGKETA